MSEHLSEQAVTQILATAAGFDNRKPSDTALQLWTVALNLGGPPRLEDAVEAVVRHYATSTEYLMPSHVLAGARAVASARRAALPPVEVLMAGVDPDDPEWSAIRRSREDRWLTSNRTAITQGATT